MFASFKKDKAKIFPSAVQIPLISNDATTGHKLQGSSLDAVCIPSWSCSTNWPCVMLSRVRTLDGLCLGKPLNPSKDCSVPQNLQRMLRKLRRNKVPAELGCDQLDLNRTQIDVTQTTFGLDSNAEMHRRAVKQTASCCVSINTQRDTQASVIQDESHQFNTLNVCRCLLVFIDSKEKMRMTSRMTSRCALCAGVPAHGDWLENPHLQQRCRAKKTHFAL
jgi:hypothetical protein